MGIAGELVESGVFDAAYYLASYGHDMLGGQEPAAHFVHAGFHLGLKPNPAVDPIIRRLRSPGRPAAELIRELIRAARTSQQPDRVSQLIAGELPQPDEIDPDRPGWVDPVENVRHAHRLGRPHVTDFVAGGETHSLRVPAPAELLSRFREDRAFSLARISHGDWDGFYFAEVYRRHLAAVLGGSVSEAELKMLAYRLCEELHETYDNFAENFMLELEEDLRARPSNPDFLMSVAFKGNPTIDEEIFDGSPAIHPVDFQRLDIFARYFSPDETLFDANVFKRWLLSGDLRELPSLARERPVILMGAEWLSTLGVRWQLPWFSHIVIPPEFSYPMRRALLDTCLARIGEARSAAARLGLRKPLFILQGSSFAFWFQMRLFARHPDVFYLDLGQALHAWFYDIRKIPLRTWGRRYAAAIVRNTGLEDYYAGRGVAHPVVETLFRNRKVDLAEP